MAEAQGGPRRPYFHDPLREVLIARGREHEAGYLDRLRAEGLRVVDLGDVPRDEAERVTVEHLRDGVDVIAQGTLGQGAWSGRPDVLRRVERPSAFGAWSYEVHDTKLASETRAGTIVQLGLYSEWLEGVQGARPEHFQVVTPDPAAPFQRYRTDDYAAYVRWARAQMDDMVARPAAELLAAHYPEPVEHCEVCPWSSACNKRRRADDHVSLVAGISRVQRGELGEQAVTTLTGLAEVPLPIPFRPRRGAVEPYTRVREQARMQLQSRGLAVPLHELRDDVPGEGLHLLPEPSPGDVFLDLEGDAFAREGGREYLFGLVTIDPSGAPAYQGFWAFSDHEERLAFEAVMDLISSAWEAHPGMHVYHYAPYEPSAFKRLMGRYATREAALDRMLRGERFVDLYAVVRQGLRAGVERYSIKNLEPLYGFSREVPLEGAGLARTLLEHDLDLGQAASTPADVREAVLGYNRDDCVSAWRLRDWLEGLRAEAIAAGTPVPRPVAKEAAASEDVAERDRRVAELRALLLSGVPEDRAGRDDEAQARWLLAYLLDFHRREDKAVWWEYYRLRDLPEADLFDEPRAVAGLELDQRVGPFISRKTGRPTSSVIDRYRYPVQEMEIRAKDPLKLTDGTDFGEVVTVDRAARTLDVKKGPSVGAEHPTAVFAHKVVQTKVLEEALCRLGDGVVGTGGAQAAPGLPDLPARRLLLGLPPVLRSGAFAPQPGEAATDFAVRIAGDLDETVLAIQGPPGAGKTYSGARMIRALVAQGKKVGVTATGHKVIRNLLGAVAENAGGVDVRLGHKGDEGDDAPTGGGGIAFYADNADAASAIGSGQVNVLGGTSWMWARPEFAGSVDVLFVDEAGQMSLANVLAVCGAARSVVLLGDPQQLDQPQKGTHPEGVGVSALEHLLGGHQTLPADRGLFLPVTYRLAPSLAAFTSEQFYEGRLESKAGLERQRLVGTDGFDGAGLFVVEVPHDHNRNASMEEVEAVAALIARLTGPGAGWVDEDGQSALLLASDVLVVAPYNAQVSRLAERLAATGARVGTVDKFQGQQAPVVIYSMATSRPEDAPRGMEFLYSLNRLNVATSRAQCVAIVVASPLLFEPECRTPRQIRLANALCRYREMVRTLVG